MTAPINNIDKRSYGFALQIIQINNNLQNVHKEFTLSKQLLRSGTSIGANIREAKFAQSDADFISKLSISLKEANETQYWLELLHDSGYLDDNSFNSIYGESKEITAILVTIIKKLKNKVEE